MQAIHGKYIMPGCTDPLVVRYADAPGSRAKKGGGGAGAQRGFNGGYGQPSPGYNGFGGMGGGGWGGGGYGNGPAGWNPNGPYPGFMGAGMGMNGIGMGG